MKRIFTLLLCIAICLPFTFNAKTVKANSGLTHWAGADTSGVIATDDNCPLIVEKERLVFDISDTPKHDQPNENYNSTVSAEYVFYNPSDIDVEVNLAFPIWLASYSEPKLDSDNYKVEVDENVVSKKIRYTYFRPIYPDYVFAENGFEKIIALSQAKYKIDENSPVYEYHYSGLEGKEYLIKQSGDGQNCLVVSNCPLYRSVKDGERELRIARTSNVCIYVIGEKPSDMYLSSYDSGESSNKEYHSRIVEMTFSEFFDRTISSQDLYWSKEEYQNIVIDVINADGNRQDGKRADFRVDDRDFKGFVRWFEYDMHVKAGERVVNKVTVPIYPSIKTNWKPYIYEYQYFLSPAKCWNSFGELEIIINTDKKIVKSGDFVFENTDNGYRLLLEGLPDGDLAFTLCEDEDPLKRTLLGCYISIYNDAFVLGVLLLAVATIRLLSKKIKSKS